ncbi:unnamed protein product, partial [marine sediment metagenome]
DLNGETSRWKTIGRGLKDQVLTARGLVEFGISMIGRSPLSLIAHTSRSIIAQNSNAVPVTIDGETKKVYEDYVYKESLPVDFKIKLKRGGKNNYLISRKDGTGGMISNKQYRQIVEGAIYDNRDKLNVTSLNAAKTDDIKNLVEIGNYVGAYHEARVLNDIKTANTMINVSTALLAIPAVFFSLPAAGQGGTAVAVSGTALKQVITRGVIRKAGLTIGKRVLTRKAGLTIAKRAAIGA